ncbi:carboxy-terminal domain RNA polymerase II polypeptide A small phosphatase 1-like [Phalaenopsis equestris]|uniref:carboxy-terminal domain RNA polymerase II polypeptide A small phosphatase 1-like n=1 Tax=Phalaenopsis equestris TaxID=78828 RepID=UPI0009E4F397|nr:carboxy-terminal domain RNA polymerase II polypeptide A small phosphatase 1-like [Phalaenopsis equestris]
MSELAASEVFASGPSSTRTLQVWRTLMSWFSFVFRILWQIVKGTPSLSQVLSFLGVRHPLLSSSLAFKPLPAHAPTDTPPPAASEQTAAVGKLMVVLDLDETLVCAYESSSLPSFVRNQAIEAGLRCFELECMSGEKGFEGEPKVNHVTVFERPGLQEFLQQISEFADLVLFTAGLEGYARPLVDKIDVDNRFSHRLYRPATVSTEFQEHVKDISHISKDMCRTVIVDNNPFSFLLQPLNGIPCVPFSAGQPYDEQLLGVILPLLKRLSLQKDVRPVLYEKFNMPEWFKQHGIPIAVSK